MRGKIRQWFAERPRAMTAAYFVLMSGSILVDIGVHDASGATTGP
ncbi:hypothetical protein [Halorussus halobius]|nr:hypothetical protein [Halorussus halobius]